MLPRLAALFVTLVLVGCPSTEGPSGEEPAPTWESLGCAADDGGESGVLLYEGDVECGAVAYADTCVPCHGPEGEGTDDGPALGEHVSAHTDLELALILSQGTGDMEDPEIANDAAAHVLAWMRHHFGEYDGEGH